MDSRHEGKFKIYRAETSSTVLSLLFSHTFQRIKHFLLIPWFMFILLSSDYSELYTLGLYSETWVKRHTNMPKAAVYKLAHWTNSFHLESIISWDSWASFPSPRRLTRGVEPLVAADETSVKMSWTSGSLYGRFTNSPCAIFSAKEIKWKAVRKGRLTCLICT